MCLRLSIAIAVLMLLVYAMGTQVGALGAPLFTLGIVGAALAVVPSRRTSSAAAATAAFLRPMTVQAA